MTPSVPKKRGAQRRGTAARKKSRSDTAPPSIPDATPLPPSDAESRHDVMPFRFLDLPAELRNSCYEKVLEFYPEAWLSRNSARHYLATKSALVGVNQQVREEFLSVVLLGAPVIRTTVRNFNFGHLIAFLNRLSDAELRPMLSEGTTIPAERQVRIHFFRDGSEICGFDQLKRWLNRAAHPTKKGTKIDFQYVMAKNAHQIYPRDASPFWMTGFRLREVLRAGRAGSRSRAEGEKIFLAVEQGRLFSNEASGLKRPSWKVHPHNGLP